MRPKPSTECGLLFEDKARHSGYNRILGVDEAGRAPLAGPVVAAAVFLQETRFTSKIRDSKKLSPAQRETAFHEIGRKAVIGVGMANEKVIDSINILEASFVAMNEAVMDCVRRFDSGDEGRREAKDPASPSKPPLLLVDGNRFKTDLPYPFWPIVQGDNISLSIACASIVAKVIRDRLLMIYDRIYPQYGFCKHKGYPTPEHKRAIREFGSSPIHRNTFRGVREDVPSGRQTR